MMKTKLLLMLLVAFGLVAPSAQANLLVNPSFEEGHFKAKNVPDNWIMSWSSYTSAWTWFDDADGAHRGDKYIKKVSFIMSISSAWMWQTVDVTGGQEYAFSVWAKSPVETQQKEAWGFYEWLNAASSVIDSGWLEYLDLVEDDWEHADFGTKTAPALATRVMFSLIGVIENGPTGILYDDAHMGIPRPSFPSPAWEATAAIGNVDLSWTNLDPDYPATSVYVKVLFGTEPNETDLNYNMVPLTLDPNSGQDVTSVTVAVPDLNTYYWQVNSYVQGDPATTSYDTNPGDPNMIKGNLWSFDAVYDSPPSVTIGTPDMITWDNEPVDVNLIVTDEGYSPLFIEWTAEPNNIITFEPNEFVEDPTVTITKGTRPKALIVNPSFEDRLDGWDGPGWTWTGTYYATKYITPTDGFFCAYTWSDPCTDAGLSQTLTETLAADTTYTLTVDVVNDGYYKEDVQYKVQLLAGEKVLGEDDDGYPLITYGEWETSMVVCALGGENDPNFAYVGQPLEIRLLAKDGTEEMNFDNVHLTADPDFPVQPGETYTLTVTVEDAISLETDTITIDVYDDQCQAARIGAGLAAENPGDFDGDCDIDLYDLALMATKWLDNKDLTEALVMP